MRGQCWGPCELPSSMRPTSAGNYSARLRTSICPGAQRYPADLMDALSPRCPLVLPLRSSRRTSWTRRAITTGPRIATLA